MSEIANDVGQSLTRKFGPLPLWAWLGIPAGLYVAWSYYNVRGESAEIGTTTMGGAEGTDAEDYGLNVGGSYLPSYGGAPDGTSNLPDPVETPEYTNETWFRQASNYLIGEGVSPIDVVTALNAYLYGTPETITATQGDALQRALIKFGAAPDPAFMPKILPSKKKTPPPSDKPPSDKPATWSEWKAAPVQAWIGQNRPQYKVQHRTRTVDGAKQYQYRIDGIVFTNSTSLRRYLQVKAKSQGYKPQ